MSAWRADAGATRLDDAAVVYPVWSYFPSNTFAPTWTAALLEAVAAQEATVSTEVAKTGLSSDAVLKVLAPALVDIGYAVESSKAKSSKIKRPVLFGENGRPTVMYEVDAVHPGEGVVLEVEAGRGARGNAEYRDLVRTSLILDARYLALLLPIAYRFSAGRREGVEHAYRNTRDLLTAVYASQRLRFPFEGILLIGY